MNKYILGSILFVLACLTGCDDSNDPFEGTDNFITSFTLKQGDQSLVASFRGDTIVMNIPEAVMLRLKWCAARTLQSSRTPLQCITGRRKCSLP